MSEDSKKQRQQARVASSEQESSKARDMIRLMFVEKSRPISEANVRFPDADGREYETDDEGFIRVDLESGSHRVEVETSDGWIERDFEVDDRKTLVVVNLEGVGIAERETMSYFDTDIVRTLGDRYEFRRELGRGGMGVVVQARDTLLNRDVAVKILTPELQGNEEAERIFLTEAQSMAKLSHANLVAVHDVLSEDGHSMMVVEFITGRNLEQAINDKGALSQKAVINIGVQLCRVIEYLHSEGVIHRDLKPANVMIEEDGTLKLIDFGLARSLEHIANRGTKIRGTPAYMAPEQVLGQELSAATDIYQIGVTLFEALTGELPFKKGNVAYQHVHEEPPAVENVGQNVFPVLSELVDACLAKDPDDRPESAQALKERLESIRDTLTSGRISAVQLTDQEVSADTNSTGLRTSDSGTLLKSPDTGPESAITPGGSVNAGSGRASAREFEEHTVDEAPAASGPASWLWGVGAALLLLIGSAFYFGQSLVGERESTVQNGEENGDIVARSTAGGRASGAATDDEEDEEVSERIEAARAVGSARQIIRSANTASRAVVDLAPNARTRRPSASDDSGGRGARGGSNRRTGAAAQRGSSARPTDGAKAGATADNKSAGAKQPPPDDETDGKKAEEQVAKDTSGGDGTSEVDKTEAASAASTDESETKSWFDGSPEAKEEPAAPEPSVDTSDPESASQEEEEPNGSTTGTASREETTETGDNDDQNENNKSENERETRSAPVSF